MKKYFIILISLCFLLSLDVKKSKASELNPFDLEKVTLSLLHPAIVSALESHYGGFTQFQNQRIVKIVPKQLPADTEYDSSFKATGWAYEITVTLEALRGESKKEMISLILTNEFSDSGYTLKKILIK